MKKLRKKGLFLSIELTVVLIVIVAIVAMIVAGGGFIMKGSKQARIVQESEEYMSAIISFKAQLGYWPGDVPADVLAANSSFVNSAVATVTTTTQASANCAKDIYGNSEVGLVYQYKPTTGLIDSSGTEGSVYSAKSYLAFPQLVQGGYLTMDISVTSTDDLCSATNDVNVIAKKWRPKARFDKKLAWAFNVFQSDIQRARLGYLTETYTGGTVSVGDGSGLYPIALNAYKKYWGTYYLGQPILTLYRYSSDSSNPLGVEISPYISSTSNGFGALSPEVVYGIDKKIDDGRPFGIDSKTNIKGRVTANHGNYSTSGANCYLKSDGTKVDGTASKVQDMTLSEILAAEYSENDYSGGAMGCIVMFKGLDS